MNLQVFVCFHKKIFPDIYKVCSTENETYLTFYGVKDKYSGIKNVIYEYELNHYNPMLQKNKYNEGSCIYHIYKNNLYNKYDYIGFCQYDMVFPDYFFKDVEYKISKNNNTILHLDFFHNAFFGGQTTIIKDYFNIPAGLNSYNAFFNTNYTSWHLISNKMITNNTFIIPRKMYEKMMAWLVQYFKDDIHKLNKCDYGHEFDPGHMIEALTGMFLSLEINEGAVYEKLNLDHNHDYKLIE